MSKAPKQNKARAVAAEDDASLADRIKATPAFDPVIDRFLKRIHGTVNSGRADKDAGERAKHLASECKDKGIKALLLEVADAVAPIEA